MTEEEHEEMKGICVPIKFSKPKTRRWREKIVVANARALGYHVIFLDFQEVNTGLVHTEEKGALAMGTPTTTTTTFASIARLRGDLKPQYLLHQEGGGGGNGGADDSTEEDTRPTLFVLPFYDTTSGLLHNHNVYGVPGEAGPRSCEPTHFCHSPYVWEHVYDRIHRGLQMWFGAGRDL